MLTGPKLNYTPDTYLVFCFQRMADVETAFDTISNYAAKIVSQLDLSPEAKRAKLEEYERLLLAATEPCLSLLKQLQADVTATEAVKS